MLLSVQELGLIVHFTPVKMGPRSSTKLSVFPRKCPYYTANPGRINVDPIFSCSGTMFSLV